MLARRCTHTTLVSDRRPGRPARRARLGRRRPDRAPRPPHRLPRPGLGAGRRAARRRRAGTCGRSTSAATATATRPIPAGDAYRWTGFAADVLAVVDHLGVARRPGARRVRALEGRGGTAPRRSAAAGNLPARSGPTNRSCSPTDAAADLTARRLPARDGSARRRRNEWSSIDEAYDAYASKPPLDVMTPESLRAYVDYGLRDRGDGVFELKCAPEVEARVYAMAPANGAWAVLPDVRVVRRRRVRRDSTDIGPTLARRIADRLPHGAARGVARRAATSARNRIPTGAPRRSSPSRTTERELRAPAGSAITSAQRLGIRTVRRVERAAVDHACVAADELGRDAVGLGDHGERVRARRRR